MALSALAAGNPAARLDAEFFSSAALRALTRIEAGTFATLASISKRIQHPLEIQREYVDDDGIATLMAGNIRPNRADSTNLPMMEKSRAITLSQNKLNNGDVLLVRTGANFGTVAPWKLSNPVYACADLLIVRSPELPSGYISSFLSGAFGKPLVDRCSYGSAQPHISPTYIGLVPVPRFHLIESKVDEMVDQAVLLENSAHAALVKAQSLLLNAVGLQDWSPPEPLTYTRSVAEISRMGRLDSEFAAPKVQALLRRLSQNGATLRDYASVRRTKFKPASLNDFSYIEIGDLDGFGRAAGSIIAAAEAPSRATWHVRSGDVITSMVRPIRRLSAIVSADQDNNVCSSGFVVLQPTSISPECLLTYLRLPLICQLMDLFATASMYPALSEGDLMRLPVPLIADDVAKAVTSAVRRSRLLLNASERLLTVAKSAVEIAIEQNEAAGVAYIAGQQEVINAVSL
jgi:hypothetical protein